MNLSVQMLEMILQVLLACAVGAASAAGLSGLLYLAAEQSGQKRKDQHRKEKGKNKMKGKDRHLRHAGLAAALLFLCWFFTANADICQAHGAAVLGRGIAAHGRESAAYGRGTAADGGEMAAYGRGTAADGGEMAAYGRGTAVDGGEMAAYGRGTAVDSSEMAIFGRGTAVDGRDITADGVGEAVQEEQQPRDTGAGTGDEEGTPDSSPADMGAREQVSLIFAEDTEPVSIEAGIAYYNCPVYADFTYSGPKGGEQVKKALCVSVRDSEDQNWERGDFSSTWTCTDKDGYNEVHAQLSFSRNAMYAICFLGNAAAGDSARTDIPEGIHDQADDGLGDEADDAIHADIPVREDNTAIYTGEPGLPLVFVIAMEEAELPREDGERSGEDTERHREDTELSKKDTESPWTCIYSRETSAMNRHYVKQAGDISVTVSCHSDFTFNRVTLYRNSEPIELKRGREFTVRSDADRQKTLSLLSENFRSDGVYRLIFTCKSEKGDVFCNNDDLDTTLNFGVDATPPAVEIADLAEGVTYEENVKNISVSAKDNLKLMSLQVFVDGAAAPFHAWDEDALDRMERMGQNCQVEIPGDDRENITAHSLLVVAEDEAGNIVEHEVSGFFVQKPSALVRILLSGTFWVAVAAVGATTFLLAVFFRKKRKGRGSMVYSSHGRRKERK